MRNVEVQEVQIVSAKRTPIGKYLGALKEFSAVELGAKVMKAIIGEENITASSIDFLIMGNVLKAGLGQNPARLAGVKAGIPSEIGGYTIDQVCASSLTAVTLGAQYIRSGRADIVLAGGMESMSRARIALPPHLKWGVQFDPNTPQRFRAEDLMMADGLFDGVNEKMMGEEADLTARKFGITREEADEFAYQSHMKAARATEQGEFDEELVPIQTNEEPLLQKDEGIRPDTSIESLSNLPPVFSKDGTITAGNSSQLSDGASVVLLMRRQKTEALGLEPIASIVDWDTTFYQPKEFIVAPVPSVKHLLARNEKEIDDIDLIEHNEAFAHASVLVKKELNIDPSKLNVRGGAVALGHPIGASGARILTTLVHAMKDKKKKTGIATICHGGGGAVSMLVKRAK